MRNSRNKTILIIVISVVLILAIVSGTLAYLFLATDVFKGDKELFVKYIAQNNDTISAIKNSETSKTYQNLRTDGISETNTEIAINYSEGGEVSSPINELAFRIDTQRDNINNYFYNKSAILFRDEEYLKAELINDKDLSGIRFFVKQFISVRNTEDLSKIAEAFGLETSELENYVQMLEGTALFTDKIISEEQINILKDKYIGIIKSNFEKATFSHLKNAMITVNNNTIKTNAYEATLNQEQVRSLVLQILNNIETDEIILEKIRAIGMEEIFTQILDSMIEEVTDKAEFYELKVTVYEQKGVTVRTAIEVAKNVIFIDNSQSKVKIQRNVINSEKEESQVVEIEKINSENEETYNIGLTITDGEEIQTVSLKNEMQKSPEAITLNTELKYTKGITTVTIKAETTTNIVNEIQKKIELEQSNNVVLSDLDDETMQGIVKMLTEKIPELAYIRIDLLKDVLGIKTEETPNNNGGETMEEPTNPQEMAQVEINRFNAKFEFYTGDSVTSQNVQTLLDVVKLNLNSIEITPIEGTENENGENAKVNMKLNIEKGMANEELANQVLENIKKDKKYKVSISYKSENGLIDYINISEVVTN